MTLLHQSGRPLRVCVCTSSYADAEPRAPRHAAALASLGDEIQIVFVDCAPAGTLRRAIKTLEGRSNVTRQTHYFAHRRGKPLRLAMDRLRQRSARRRFKATGEFSSVALSTRMLGLERLLALTKADIYLGHNIDTLLPISRVAAASGAPAMFDSMEFHSDVGDGQSELDRALVRSIENECLPRCALVLASSDQVADALVEQYGVERPLPLYNKPPLEKELPPRSGDSFALYWRNTVIGLGQRGLEEALVAISRLPARVTLHLQGALPKNGTAGLEARISGLGIVPRVVFHAPYQSQDAVREAARHTVGLCLERKGIRNHELTVSNKIFDYHMAGLATLASDLAGLRAVINRSSGGLLFAPGSVDDLVEKISLLYANTTLLLRLQANARAFALREGNREMEMKKFVAAFSEVCRHRLASRFAAPDCRSPVVSSTVARSLSADGQPQ